MLQHTQRYSYSNHMLNIYISCRYTRLFPVGKEFLAHRNLFYNCNR